MTLEKGLLLALVIDLKKRERNLLDKDTDAVVHANEEEREKGEV